MSGFFGRQRDTGGNGKKDLPGDKLAKPHRFLYLSVTRLCVWCCPLSNAKQGHLSTWNLHEDPVSS